MGNPHLSAMRKLFQGCQYRYDTWTLFGDCMEMMAIALSNAVDWRQREAREKRYLEIAGRYDRPTLDIFARVLGELVDALEYERCDILGALFHDLELHNKARGQYFTPYPICKFMAGTTLGEEEVLRSHIEAHGFLTACEPACGSGAMVIALADTMLERNINYQSHLHATAIDVDPRAIHMAYCQLTLLHIPARLVVGNSLSGEVRENWFTPAHIIGSWNARLAVARDGQGGVGEVDPAPGSALQPRAAMQISNEDAKSASIRKGPQQLSA